VTATDPSGPGPEEGRGHGGADSGEPRAGAGAGGAGGVGGAGEGAGAGDMGGGTPHLQTPPIGLLDALGVAAAVVDAETRIVFWSPQAERLFGYSAEEALGQRSGELLVDPDHLPAVQAQFSQVMEGETWAGGFPVRCKDGTMRRIEFRNMRLLDQEQNVYALGIATDQEKLLTVETDLALSTRLITQSPIGLAILDTDLRYVRVNPALERLNGVPADSLIGKTIGEALPSLQAEPIEGAARRVLETGVPLLDQRESGVTPADPSQEHAWSMSLFRLEDTSNRVLGVAAAVIDVTERHRAASEAQRARRRLALIADAGVRIGTSLDLPRTAEELAEVAVPDLADLAAVDLLDAVLRSPGPNPAIAPNGSTDFRALAVRSAYPTEAIAAADPTGEVASYAPDRLITRCVTTGRPVHVPHLDTESMDRIARDAEAASVLAAAGAHSYLAVPLIARGKVIGALSLVRARNPLPFDKDDVLLASELAARAAVSIDNARWYDNERRTALALQRSLLPQQPPRLPGLEIAYRYQPAGTTSEVGGDWFDVIPLPGGRTALVVGDVMGSGVNAAATMGQLRTAIRTLAGLDFEPATLLSRLHDTVIDAEETYATCVYAIYDPQAGRCEISNAGHLPPVVVRADGRAELLAVSTGVPLGAGGVAFDVRSFDLAPGDVLVLYTDGLVETRTDPIDERLQAMVELLSGDQRTIEETCDLLLGSLRDPEGYDDVALLVARFGEAEDEKPEDEKPGDGKPGDGEPGDVKPAGEPG
jgi:PAS domain S-box-containing protein